MPRRDLWRDFHFGECRQPGKWLFQSAAFCAVPVIGNGTGYGNSGAGIVRGPDQNNIDLSITETFKVAERHAFEFRSEFFNALNHGNHHVNTTGVRRENAG
jgi:hypothetical protein